ncbi:MAG TPA: hypothetical protein PKA66_10055 [Gemmatimonadales bacterium]|nr:hypothetical protein [Gemmatimonadales bacterium]
MSAPPGQIGTIVRTDLRLRLRRPATLWLVVALSGLAYLMIPDPGSGKALMVVDGARALYTSQVIATTTAALAGLLLTFVGFYLTSNALRRDQLARTGAIIAATPVSSTRYLVGKWLGGSAYLGMVGFFYLLNVMALHFLRAEGAFEPFTYLLTYLVVLGPAVLVVAALALCFECVPLLSGRLGDVGYFFLWTTLMVAGAVGSQGGGGSVLDVLGIGFVLQLVNAATGAQSLSMGVTPFDPTLAPWILPPIRFAGGVLLPRLETAALAAPVLLVARLAFHRFDPARVRGRDQAAGGRLVPQVSRLLTPLTRVVSRAGHALVSAAPATLRPVLSETVMTLCQSPLVVLAWLGVVATTVVGTTATVHHTLPLAVAVVLAITLADLATRDRAAGTLSMLFSMPGVKEDYAWIKMGAATLLALFFFVPPALRIVFTAPDAALSLLVAAGFMGTLATALGLLARTPKAFMGVFLLFLFLVLNGAQAPALDFAGWNGVATGSTRIGYLLATVLLAGLASGKHRSDLRRER